MTRNTDSAHRWTDEELAKLERRMGREYSQAAREMREKQAKWLAKFDKEREQREKALDSTQEAMDAHRRWLQSQAIRETWFSDMVDGLAESAHKANERAAGMVNDHLPKVYAENANRAAFAVDKAVRADTRFALVNEDAIRYLMGGMEHGQLIHEVTLNPEQERLAAGLQSMRRNIDAAKDISWNRQKFASAITQGILQGESIPNIVKRTESIYGMNRDAATRAARTSTTSAENAGRMSSFERAERLGIDMEIEWLATLDVRTRSSHRALDGERIKTGERFSNGLRWPGDPSGPGEELWNCRCRANGRVIGFDGKRGGWVDEKGERWSRLPDGITYEEWKAAKSLSRAESYENEAGMVSGGWYADRSAEAVSVPQANGFAGIAEGQDILDTWQRRPDQFDFEIEDVINAQGFDGMPRVVDANDFDRAVGAANGGDGLVMQRTYTAPDQETIDSYRDMLYNGKWYVDCSEGGAQYGQGMYCAADYSGILSDGIKDEMQHYIDLGRDRIAPKIARETIDVSEIASSLMANHDSVQAVIDFLNKDFSAVKRFDSDPKMRERIHEAVTSKLSKLEKSATVPSYIETMTLDQSAKIITWRDAMTLQDEIWKPGMPGDLGSFVAAMGYDAINAAGHGASGSYTIVLNRTKLIIRRPQ